jgi:hypothetical protein
MDDNVREQIFVGKVNTTGGCLIRIKKDVVSISRENRNKKNIGRSLQEAVFGAAGLPETHKGRKIAASNTFDANFHVSDLFDVFL